MTAAPCPHCGQRLEAAAAVLGVCPSCRAALPPVPVLTGPPARADERLLMNSRASDIALGITAGLLFPLLSLVVLGFARFFIGAVPEYLGMLVYLSVLVVPWLAVRRRFPILGRALGMTSVGVGLLYLVIIAAYLWSRIA